MALLFIIRRRFHRIGPDCQENDCFCFLHQPAVAAENQADNGKVPQQRKFMRPLDLFFLDKPADTDRHVIGIDQGACLGLQQHC